MHISIDPFFAVKVRDMGELYLNPLEGALVVYVDEQNYCQPLGPTHPVLPMGLDCPEGVTHDYVMHGTTTRSAASDMANDQVLNRCRARPRHRRSETNWTYLVMAVDDLSEEIVR